jgi:hypothetical protein
MAPTSRRADVRSETLGAGSPADEPRTHSAFALLLVVAVVGAWMPSLGASFQFDDWNVIVDDPRVQSLAAWAGSMPGTRALTKLSFAVNHELGGDAAAFRAFNVALHAANALLLWTLLRRLAPAIGHGDRSTLAAACATLAFALHPVQTESVTYVAGRSNVLMATFALLALLAWLQVLRSSRPLAWQIALLTATACALAAKETAAVLPLAMVLVAVVAAAGRARAETSVASGAAIASATATATPTAIATATASTGATSTRRWLVALLPATALVGVALVAAVAFLPYDYLLRTSLATRSPLENLVAQVPAIGWLFGQLVRWDRLNADPALAPVGTLSVATALSAALLVSIMLLALSQLHRRPAFAFGVLWTFLWLAPTNSLLARLDLVNERQWYLAVVGPAWLLGLAAERALVFVAPSRRPRATALVPLVLCAVLAAGTLQRNRVYHDEVTFWTDVRAKSPWNARAENNLGIAHAYACNPDAAAAAFARAMQLAPDDPLPAVNRELLLRGELSGVPAECRRAP